MSSREGGLAASRFLRRFYIGFDSLEMSVQTRSLIETRSETPWMSCTSPSPSDSSSCPAGSFGPWIVRRGHVNAMDVLATVLSVGVLIYLMVALLKPEWF